MELYACCSNTNDSATNWVTDSTRDLRDDGQSDGEEYLKMSKEKLKPGEKALTSGQYEVINPDTEGQQKETTSIKDNPLLPAQKAGTYYELVDKTKHKEN